jgi:predicted dehydrogenase
MNIGVVGVGKLGKIHTRIYKENNTHRLTGICDINRARLESVKKELEIDVFSTTDYKNLLSKNIQAVSIASDTGSHYSVAKFFLENNIHCLVEKPLTTDIKQAQDLLDVAKKNNVLLMVGLVERFNSAFQEVKKIAKNPVFIECHRLTPFPHRSLDISVVLDLMIHDLDIILSLVKSDLEKAEAIGVNVLSDKLDIANARLTFKNGCIANITSSRISQEKTRKIRLFLHNAYISLDYAEQGADIYQKQNNRITKESLKVEKQEPLKKEIEYFLSNIGKKTKDYTFTYETIAALKLALQIEKQAGKE